MTPKLEKLKSSFFLVEEWPPSLLPPSLPPPSHTHTPPPRRFHSRVASFVSPMCETSAVDMMNVDGAGAAKRRRERRLRSWMRHEQMTVAAEFAAALHHSCGEARRHARSPSGTDACELRGKAGRPGGARAATVGEHAGVPVLWDSLAGCVAVVL